MIAATLALLQSTPDIGLIEQIGRWSGSTILAGVCVFLWRELRAANERTEAEMKRTEAANERTLAAYDKFREVSLQNVQALQGLTVASTRLAERIEAVEDILQSERQRPRR